MSEFRMPSLGADMEAGKLVEWLVKPGDMVKHGDIIAVVETQKGAIEIEVFEDGIFARPLVEIGTKVPVGTPLAIIVKEGEAGAEPAEPAAKEAPAPPTARPETAPAPTPTGPAKTKAAPPQPTPTGRVKITPAARKLAEDAGLDLSGLVPSGPAGEIVRADVLARTGMRPPKPPAGAQAAPSPPLPEAQIGMRAAIAAAMSRSKREIPHYYLSHSADISAAQAFVTAQNQERDPSERLLVGALFVKAVSLAAKKYPEFNGHFVDGDFQPSAAVHAGVAINIRGTGLVAPAIHDSNDLAIDDLMGAMRDLVQRVRAGRFRGSELSDPTITISSLGERGVDALYGVIYPPQVAIVGVGTSVERAWAENGMIGVRPVVTLTLAGDHRVSDGHRGALFLSTIADLLTTPEAL